MLKGGSVVAPDMVINIDPSLPLLSNAKSNPSPQEEKLNGNPTTGAALPKDSKQLPVDTVSISPELLQTNPEVIKEEAKKREEAKVAEKKPDLATAKVEFVYDQKGDLITKYMDSADRLIYQTPSELMLLLRETAATVDTKA